MPGTKQCISCESIHVKLKSIENVFIISDSKIVLCYEEEKISSLERDKLRW